MGGLLVTPRAWAVCSNMRVMGGLWVKRGSWGVYPLHAGHEGSVGNTRVKGGLGVNTRVMAGLWQDRTWGEREIITSSYLELVE
jgi:hypothetical protein